MNRAARPSWPQIAGIAVCWAALAVYVEVGYATHGGPVQVIIHDWVPGFSWLATGMIAWRRRPEVVIGKVMVVIGFAWFIGGLNNHPWQVAVRELFADVDLSLIAWLVFAYPSGRIERTYERVYVTSVIAWIAAAHISQTLTFNPPTYYHCGCTRNGLALFDSPHAYDVLTSIENPIGAAVAAGVVLLLIARFARMTPPARRALSGLWVGSLLIAVFEIADNAASGASGSLAWDWVKDGAYAAVPVAFLFGLAGVRVARGRVGRLVDELAAPDGIDVRLALARALGDPSLEVLYRVEGSDGLVDADGHPRDAPLPGHGRDSTPLVYRGQRLGVLVHDPALSDQPELIGSVCAAAGLALTNQRLQAEVLAQLAEVRASRSRIVQAGDAERRRIERNLHDGAQQRLVATRLSLRLAASRAGPADQDLARELHDSIRELEEAIGELRTLARGIHPAVLTEQGLAAAVDVLVERATVPVRVDDRLDGRLPAETEAAAYYVIAEALTNVEKYARASCAQVTVGVVDEHLCVEISDDGVGGADPASGTGLLGLVDRVSAAGGRLVVTSPAGEGTCVRATLPVPLGYGTVPTA